MKRLVLILLIFTALPLAAQVDRREVRSGNRKFRKQAWQEAELEYRKAVLKDSLSVAGEYNLASSLYRQGSYDEAAEALGRADQEVAGTLHAASYYYNEGDVVLQRKDYSAAVKAFRQSLLLNPGDMDAKENYIYAKEMLKNQQQGGGGDNNQDQQDRNQQNQQDQQDRQNQPSPQQDQPEKQDQQPQPQEISRQQARQMLKAVQAQEKETQDKVKKEKAALLKSSQKEKNW